MVWKTQFATNAPTASKEQPSNKMTYDTEIQLPHVVIVVIVEDRHMAMSCTEIVSAYVMSRRYRQSLLPCR
jgi:hypothetical protein